MSFADRSAARRLRRTPTVEVLKDRLLMAGDDIFEENDTKAIVDARVAGEVNSPNVGVVTGSRTLNNLALQDSADWYKFQTAGVGTPVDSVRIDYAAADGNLQLEVLRADATSYVGWCYGGGDFDQVSLAGERSGTYYVHVFAADAGNYNTSYTLQISPPPAKADDAYEE